MRYAAVTAVRWCYNGDTRLFYKTWKRKWSGHLIFRKGRVGKIISIWFTFQYFSKIASKNVICACNNSTITNIYAIISLDFTSRFENTSKKKLIFSQWFPELTTTMKIQDHFFLVPQVGLKITLNLINALLHTMIHRLAYLYSLWSS